LKNEHDNSSSPKADGLAGHNIITFPAPTPIDHLFTHYLERVVSELPFEVVERWNQPAERTLTLHEVIGLFGEDEYAETLMADKDREVAMLEFEDTIVKIVMLKSALIFVDLATNNIFQSRSLMNAISEKLQALGLEDPEA
jgi:hypothetical protein